LREGVALKNPPDCPKSWHFVAESKSIKKDKPYLFELFGEEFILFRDENNKISAVSPRCAHLGACFSTGYIKEGKLVCPFHAWKYAANGECVELPSGAPIPKSAKLKSYPVHEQWGLVFLFNDEVAAFDFPFFDDFQNREVIRSKCYEVYQEGVWYTVPSNAFDSEHFIHVHNRYPTKEPVIAIKSPHLAHIKYQYEIKGKIWSDRLMCILFGNVAELDFSNWAGNLILATTKVGPFQNKMLIFLRPLTMTTSVSQIFVFRKKQGLLGKMLCEFQAKASQLFFAKEARELKKADIINGNFTASDKNLVTYLKWLGDAS